jgi:hypothetical protein
MEKRLAALALAPPQTVLAALRNLTATFLQANRA